MDARCPACKEPAGRTVSRDVLDAGGLSVTFECEACGERWTVVF